jgi:hypothetical protein
MKKTFIFNILIFFLFSSISLAQEYKLGKVSQTELEEKEHPIDKDAVASYLFKNGKSYFTYTQNDGFKLVTEVEVKLKIYKKEGLKYANHEYKYYVANNPKEQVFFKDAFTYNLVNGKIEKTKLKNEGEFTEETSKFYNTKKIVMPNVKEGSIIEYKMEFITPYFQNFDVWNFQYDIPVNYSLYKTNIPEYFTYNIRSKGYFFPKSNVEKLNKSFSFSSSNDQKNGGRVTHENQSVDYIETQTSYISSQVPALKDEKFVNNINNYRSSINHELVMTNFPESTVKSFATNWEEVTNTIYKSTNFGEELNKNGYYEEDLKAVLQNTNNQDQKIDAIFNFVKNNIKWNNYTGIYTDEGVKKAYKNKTGNVAEINLMLTSMLRYAGIETSPVLVSTRDHEVPLFPSRSAFNYIICAVEVPEALILLDATNSYTMPNILPFRAINWVGRLIRKDGSSTEVPLYPNFLSKEIHNLNYELTNQGKIKGINRTSNSLYNAFLFRNNNENISQDNYIENLEKENNDISIENYEVTGKKELAENIIETYNFTSDDFVETIGDKIYLSPMLFHGMTQNPFKLEKREYPIDFIVPIEEKYIINIKIPEGYVVDFIPEKMALETGDNIALFKYNIVVTGQKIQILITNTNNISLISPDYYDTIKAYYQKMVDKQMEKIVLKKL